uniref:UDP-glucuronosyltransferase n=1 Tax=Trialeurodes vaporariorum TaxID=88556 RepID=A0A873P527_TRIVP|nr:UDP-gluconosyltransferase [Trialeurodes vaporariorum]
MLTLLAGFLLTFGVPLSESANILAFLQLPFNSHIIGFQPLMKELARKGHNVTVVNVRHVTDQIPNYTSINVKNAYADIMGQEMFHTMNRMSVARTAVFLWDFGLAGAEAVFNLPEVQRLIHSEDLQFDLIMFETFFFHEAFTAFGHKYKAPIINLQPLFPNPVVCSTLGNPYSYAYIPDYRMSATDNMTFTQRLTNALTGVFQAIGAKWYYLPKQDALMRRYFTYPGSETLPFVGEMLKDTALTLVDTHISVSPVRPYAPNVVEVAGMHLRAPSKLPQDIQSFMDSAKNGVIFFSMGSLVTTANLPEKTLQAIVQVFSKLKQKVLWKWEDDNLKLNLPNVKISKWFPQQDILAHPKCKLFLTHGGIHSLLEAIHHGVPVLGVPVFADQFMNMLLAEERGFGKMIRLEEITSETLSEALQHIMNNESYKQNAEAAGRILNDQPIKPLDLGTYWVEFVLRHKGAKHLRPAAVELKWYQYLLVDVVAFILVCMVFVVYLMIFSINFVKKLYQSRSKTDNKKKVQ